MELMKYEPFDIYLFEFHMELLSFLFAIWNNSHNKNKNGIKRRPSGVENTAMKIN